MAGLDTVLGWLKGTPTAPSLGMEKAPPLAQYPTNADAEYARKYGHGYGSGNEPFLDNEATRVIGRTVPEVIFEKGKPKSGKPLFMPEGTMSLMNSLPERSIDALASAVNAPDKTGILRGVDNAPVSNIMMRAGLAANRSPIAALGFDPDKVVLDSQSGDKKFTLGGAYLPQPKSTTDNMYVNLSQPDGSTIVHESTHRGFQKLRDNHPDKVREIFNTGVMPSEEMVVRWLMNKNAGDPEGQDATAKLGLQQRQDSVDAFSRRDLATTRGKALEQLEALAAETIKNRRPGGPR